VRLSGTSHAITHRAEFLGRYNAHASGLDVFNDIKYFAANYLDGHDAASKYTGLKF
jgi:hypothetical protein